MSWVMKDMNRMNKSRGESPITKSYVNILMKEHFKKLVNNV